MSQRTGKPETASEASIFAECTPRRRPKQTKLATAIRARPVVSVSAGGAAAVPARPRPGWALAARAAACWLPPTSWTTDALGALRSAAAEWWRSALSVAHELPEQSRGAQLKQFGLRVWKTRMLSGRVPGCGLEPAPRTLSPHNRLCTFYFFGIHRPGAADQRPPGARRGHGWKGPWRASRAKTKYKTPRVQAGGADAMQRFDVSQWRGAMARAVALAPPSVMSCAGVSFSLRPHPRPHYLYTIVGPFRASYHPKNSKNSAAASAAT